MPLWHGWLIRRQAKQKQGGGDLIVSSSKSCQTSSDVILVWMGEVGWPRDQWAAKWHVTHCWWEYSAGVECMCVCVVSESLKVCGEWDTVSARRKCRGFDPVLAMNPTRRPGIRSRIPCMPWTCLSACPCSAGCRPLHCMHAQALYPSVWWRGLAHVAWGCWQKHQNPPIWKRKALCWHSGKNSLETKKHSWNEVIPKW